MSAPFLDYCARRWSSPVDVLHDYFQDAQQAAAEVGAKLDALPLLDGERHYLPGLQGGDSQKHYYRAHIEQDKDGTAWPCVTFGSFKAGEPKRYWKPRDLAWSDFQGAGQSSGSSSEQCSRYAEKVAQAVAEAAARKATTEESRRQGREAAAAAAAQAWGAAAASKPHPYLSAKGVENYGLKVATADLMARLWSAEDGEWKDSVTVVRRGELLLPMQDAEGRLWNLQRIDAKGRKRFIMGGRVKGTLAADAIGWRGAFAVLALLALLIAALMQLYMPTLRKPQRLRLGEQARILRNPFFVANVALSVLVFTAMFTAYTYLADMFERTAGSSLKTNIALVMNNARLAADIAAALKA